MNGRMSLEKYGLLMLFIILIIQTSNTTNTTNSTTTPPILTNTTSSNITTNTTTPTATNTATNTTTTTTTATTTTTITTTTASSNITINMTNTTNANTTTMNMTTSTTTFPNSTTINMTNSTSSPTTIPTTTTTPTTITNTTTANTTNTTTATTTTTPTPTNATTPPNTTTTIPTTNSTTPPTPPTTTTPTTTTPTTTTTTTTPTSIATTTTTTTTTPTTTTATATTTPNITLNTVITTTTTTTPTTTTAATTLTTIATTTTTPTITRNTAITTTTTTTPTTTTAATTTATTSGATNATTIATSPPAGLSGSVSAVIAVAIILAIFIMCLAVILLVIGLYAIWYVRREKKLSVDEINGKDSLHLKSRGLRKSIIMGSQMIEVDENYSPSQEIVHKNILTDTLRRRLRPVSVENLPKYVTAEFNTGLKDEFSSFDLGPHATFQASTMEANMMKNRYKNIVAYDHSRVRLKALRGVSHSDYINANYIHGYTKQNAFIAAQGPLQETLDDFWRMVWETNSQNIIMVTNLVEHDIYGNARIKCEQYWPEKVNEEIEYKSLKVLMTKETILSDFTIREVTLKPTKSSESRNVKQFHFVAWPDHGVPKFATSLISFIRDVNRNELQDTNGPHIVHCSAGVGRTGTYITLNSMLERIQVEDNVNVFEFIRLMRASRNYMVQTQEQYLFIHEALVELVTSGDTSINAEAVRTTINKYNDPNGDSYRGNTMSTISKQFMLLNEYCRQPDLDQCTAGRLEINLPKNRYPDKLPYDDYRVRIIKQSNDSSDYINASYVDGYKQKRSYIAAQSPIPDSVAEFWRMIYEKESVVIVMLCKLSENGQEMCEKYWPEKDATISFPYYTVECKEVIIKEGYIWRKLNIVFSIENKILGETVTREKRVNQMQVLEWPGAEDDLTPMLQMIDRIERIQAHNGNPPITIHCKDGMGRTGTFITMVSVLEKFKPEHIVDVFQILKKARIQRSYLVENEEQLSMCYNFILSYLDSFDKDNYSNYEQVRSSHAEKDPESDDDIINSTQETNKLMK